MSSFIVSKVTKALGVDQDHDEDDVNTPLKRNKSRRDYSVHDGMAGRQKGVVHSRVFTVCMLSFAVIFVCVIVSVSTLGLAETADIADGKGGFTVLHNIHKQNADWGKTKAASKGSQMEDDRVESLRVKVEDLERELKDVHPSGSQAPPPLARKLHVNGMSDKVGGKEEDYAKSVHRKEAAEEARIESRVAAMEKSAESVDVAGLDAKHRRILKDMKKEISDQNQRAARQANEDIARREKEIDTLLPSDSDCPGPECLVSQHPHAPSRAMGEGLHHGPKVVLVHRHKPWQKRYPGEFDNVYNSRDMPWLAGVKEVTGNGGAKSAVQHKNGK